MVLLTCFFSQHTYVSGNDLKRALVRNLQRSCRIGCGIYVYVSFDHGHSGQEMYSFGGTESHCYICPGVCIVVPSYSLLIRCLSLYHQAGC